jgi:7,8-dihydropterin-6-yl-methyl-4-(beta-D-ribofuranosyl)aminobenzene 5'-phosphate synthase
MESLTVIYDNRALPPFKPDWGFSALIETDEELLLFDTGANPKILNENFKAAEVDVESIDKVFISHNHWDHVGGLEAVLEKKREFEIFVPESDCEEFENNLPETVTCVPVSAPVYISEKFLSTGPLPTGLEKPREEQSLIVFSEKGPVLVTGCSHPGIVNIAKRALSLIGDRLFLIVGGFHLYKLSDEEVFEISEELKSLTQFVAPCHCTGDRALSLFKESWKDRFVEVKAGVEIPLSEV